jgi:SAM-dependent methyltransferase
MDYFEYLHTAQPDGPIRAIPRCRAVRLNPGPEHVRRGMVGCVDLSQDVNMGQPDDIRRSFNEIADIYDRVRPSYPAELFDDLFPMLPTRPKIVEVGPGTGQATKDLLARGASVVAVEIGPATAARLRSNLPSDRLHVSVGDFEVVDMVDSDADALFSATAYHWISAKAQTDRPAAVLRRGGLVAIVDLIQVDSPEDAGFFAASQPIYRRHGQGHTGPPAPSRGSVDPPIRAAFEADPRFDSIAVRRYDWNQTYSAAAYRDLMISYSATQMMEDSERSALLDAIESFIQTDFGGAVTRPLVVTLTTAVLERPDT